MMPPRSLPPVLPLFAGPAIPRIGDLRCRVIERRGRFPSWHHRRHSGACVVTTRRRSAGRRLRRVGLLAALLRVGGDSAQAPVRGDRLADRAAGRREGRTGGGHLGRCRLSRRGAGSSGTPPGRCRALARQVHAAWAVDYSERPMGVQLAAYVAVLARLVLASQLMRRARGASTQAPSQQADHPRRVPSERHA